MPIGNLDVVHNIYLFLSRAESVYKHRCGHRLLTAHIDWKGHGSLIEEKMTLMPQLTNEMVYQLHIRLAHIEPPIWRRLVVSGQITLFGLHQMLQVVMGWENSHLHQFIVGKTYYGEPDPEYGDTMKDDR